MKAGDKNVEESVKRCSLINSDTDWVITPSCTYKHVHSLKNIFLFGTYSIATNIYSVDRYTLYF